MGSSHSSYCRSALSAIENVILSQGISTSVLQYCCGTVRSLSSLSLSVVWATAKHASARAALSELSPCCKDVVHEAMWLDKSMISIPHATKITELIALGLHHSGQRAQEDLAGLFPLMCCAPSAFFDYCLGFLLQLQRMVAFRCDDSEEYSNLQRM